jgi:hypothetical protein
LQKFANSLKGAMILVLGNFGVQMGKIFRQFGWLTEEPFFGGGG